MKIKKVIAAALSLCMAGGAFAFNAPVVRDYSITADAAGECYTFNSTTGQLTLKGNVDYYEFVMFEQREAVKSITATEGTVLPEYCQGLFSDYVNCISIDLSKANTSNVTNMKEMFYECESLKQLDLSSFDTSRVTDMTQMFGYCEDLISLDLSNFDTSSVTGMAAMFADCNALISLDLGSFDTSNVTNMGSMFSNCISLTSLDLSSFDTRNVTKMSYMFHRCTELTSLDLSGFDTSSITNMAEMFSVCVALTSLDLSSFDTSKVTNMAQMFEYCDALTSLDLSSFDTSKVTDMGSMFRECAALTSLDLSSFDTRNVTDMSYMFYKCTGLTSLDLSSFDTGSVTNMTQMFCNCKALTSLDLKGFDTGSVTQMFYTFAGCSSLTSLDLSRFDMSGVENAKGMFDGCISLNELTLGKYFGDVEEEYKLPNANGWVNVNDLSTVISGSGEYAIIRNKGRNSYVKEGIYEKGDVNCDGEITVADAVLLQKWLLAVPNTHLPYWQNADLCADEKLNVFDLCLLKRLLVENATYTIRLEDVGEHKSSVVSIVCKYLGCSLNEAKNIVSAAPVNLTNSATKADVDQLTADLELVGATISVTRN